MISPRVVVMYNDTNHVVRKSRLLRVIKIMEPSLIAKPIANTTAEVWQFLDFSADLTKTIADLIAKE